MKFKIGDKVRFSKYSIETSPRWDDEPREVVKRGSAIIQEVFPDDGDMDDHYVLVDGFGYHWFDDELEEIPVDLLPEDLFTL